MKIRSQDKLCKKLNDHFALCLSFIIWQYKSSSQWLKWTF